MRSQKGVGSRLLKHDEIVLEEADLQTECDELGIERHFDPLAAFGGAQALKGASLAMRPGEVHGLVGANGAGKSTLIRILAGLIEPDGGRIVLDGTPIAMRSPHHAAELGMAFIHQELAFVPGIFVGCYSTFAINADWRLLSASLVAGAVLGLLCDRGGALAGRLWGHPDHAAPQAAPVNA